MKILEGNSYVCIKECKDFKGRIIPIGTICHVSKDILLYGYCEDQIYTQVEPMDDYGEYFSLYEESSYNKEQKALRNQAAISAMQGILSNNDTMHAAVCVADETMSAQVVVARNAIAYADALLQELKGE